MARLLFLFLALLTTTPAMAAVPIAQDAAAYAAHYGVAPEEALSRLKAIEQSHRATDEIAARFATRLAGIAVVHQPSLEIRVLLTGAEPVSDERFVASDGRVVPIRFATGARATRAQLVLAMRAGLDGLRSAVARNRGMGIDQRTGQVLLFLPDAPADPITRAAVERAAGAALGVPVRISPADSRVFDFSASVSGGGRVIGETDGKRFACTTGFLVTNGDETAVTTAAHCPDELTWYASDGSRVALPYIGQWGARAYDVQLNRLDAPGKAAFYADRQTDELRPVTSWRNRTSVRAGDWLCHWGEKSHYACAEVELTDYAPPGALCAGPCEPLFTTLAGPQCGAGDSGGPIFIGTTAVGIIKGGSKGPDGASCNFSYFQSVDYLPPGWRLKLAHPADEARTPIGGLPTARRSSSGSSL